ncbi:MAG: hypothetical protein R3E54_00930 [Halioglobus sp.]
MRQLPRRCGFRHPQCGQPDDSRCGQCHAPDKKYGTSTATGCWSTRRATPFTRKFSAWITPLPGDQPVVGFRISNPLTGDAYDILNDPVFTGSGASLRVGMAWNTVDYTNTGNGSDDASSVLTDALSGAIANGDGSYRLTLASPVPDGSAAPGEPATGSGVVTVEGHPVVDTNGDGQTENVPVGDVARFFSMDEPDGRSPVAKSWK